MSDPTKYILKYDYTEDDDETTYGLEEELDTHQEAIDQLKVLRDCPEYSHIKIYQPQE